MKWSAFIFLASLVFLLCAPPAGYPSGITPFQTSNRSPVVQIFGLPAIGNSKVLEAREKALTLVFDLANIYVDDSAQNERIILDGETYRLNLTGRMGIANRFEAGFELPWLFQNGGFLDGFIENYHDTFGFSQGGRDQAQQEQPPRRARRRLFLAGQPEQVPQRRKHHRARQGRRRLEPRATPPPVATSAAPHARRCGRSLPALGR